MKKQRNQYISSLDALVAVLKRLSIFENRYHLESELKFPIFLIGVDQRKCQRAKIKCNNIK